MSPTIRSHHSKELVRLLGLGDPGTGKTGSLPDLINNMAQFGIERVIIQDWDDGLDILLPHIKPEFQDKVYYETLRDELKPTQKGVDYRDATAFTRGMALMNNWKTKDYELGQAISWGKETLFVCDTLTGLGDACMAYASVKLGHGDDRWKGTGAAMDKQGPYIQMLVTLKCHIIVYSHIRFMGGGGRTTVVDKHGQAAIKEVDSNLDGTGYPSALGRQLPTQIARHFNTVLEWKLVGKNRRIRTVPEDKINIKLPFNLKEELPQDTGLTEVFSQFLNR